LDGFNAQDSTAIGEDHLSVAEFEAAFVALSGADRIRLRKLALHFANRCGGDADDLLQEAIARVLEGRRHCPRKISIVQSIRGIVSSLSSEDVETRRKGLGPVPVPDAVVELARHDGLSPEQETVSHIDDGDLLRKVQACVEGDEECGMLLEGIYDGMRGAELEELLGVDTKRLATLQRRLQRKITHLKAERAMP
jgi:DNA-directed RNA polymerase specialized sigma24 family protein